VSNLLFCDSFDHYSTAQGGRKWTTFSGSVAIAAGRTGNGLSLGISGLGSTVAITFPQGAQSEVTAGFALNSSGKIIPLTFGNAASGLSFTPSVLSDGRVTFTVNTGPNQSTTTPTTWVMQSGIWYYIELQVTATAGGGNTTVTVTYTFKVNGAVQGTGNIGPVAWNSAQNPANISWSYAQFAGGVGSVVDDFYLTDNEFLGDVAIACLMPNGDGDSSQWTCSSGTAHNAMLSEVPADDDTTYVYDDGTTLNHIDLLNLQDITGTPGIQGAQVVLTVKNDIAGNSTLQAMQKSGGTSTAGTSMSLSNNTYVCILDPRRKNPATSANYTASEINAIQIGVKRTA
jgi:hypothetical protein